MFGKHQNGGGGGESEELCVCLEDSPLWNIPKVILLFTREDIYKPYFATNTTNNRKRTGDSDTGLIVTYAREPPAQTSK